MMNFDDMSAFFNDTEFATDVRFSNVDDFVDIKGIFDDAGEEINGVVVETAVFTSEKSRVEKGWSCTINGEDFEVIYKVNDVHNYCEYFLRNITGQINRDIS